MKYKTFDLKNHSKIVDIINKSYSLAQVLKELELKPCGGNYKTINRFIKDNNINIDHLKGKGWNTGSNHKVCSPAKPLVEILNKNTVYQSHKLKQRLIQAGLKEYKCESCNLTSWLDKPIPLELDHIDGDHNNNELSNLRILCPNCHALTSTYRGRNIKTMPKSKMEKQLQKRSNNNTCSVCNTSITNKATHCVTCQRQKQEKINWPSNEELLIRLSTSNYSQLAKELGVSDNAIRHRLKRH